ncbi:MAG: Rv2578c family radical SAM protein [Streptomycetales bacterium]
MRWDNLRFGDSAADALPRAEAPLIERGAVARTFQTPDFRGITCYEIQARTIINRVPDASQVPFRWTVNPYRGCSHACFYCFARNTHTYLDLDAGHDFDSKIVVKVNAAEQLRRELGSGRWCGEHIAMGTNVDCYQRAEGRYRLMRGILEALRDFANPFSILTKGSLVVRDIDLLKQAAEVCDVHVNVSVAFLDHEIWRSLEPGTPRPHKRLEVCRTLNDAGIPCGVLMAPIVPYLTDSPAQLAATVRAIAEAGATQVIPVVLHLRPGAREWYLGWLREHHPGLVQRYVALYSRGAYAPRPYQDEIVGRVRELALRYGMGSRQSRAGRAGSRQSRKRPHHVPDAMSSASRQLSLL